MPPLSPAQKHHADTMRSTLEVLFTPLPHTKTSAWLPGWLPSCPAVHKITGCPDNQLTGYLSIRLPVLRRRLTALLLAISIYSGPPPYIFLPYPYFRL